MNLYSPLPSSVEYRGREYQMDVSYDKVLESLAFLRRKDYNHSEKLEYISFLLFGDDVSPDDGLLSAAFDVLFPEKSKGGKRVFDFEQDAAVIYASFRQAYGIDLYAERGKLHWDAFIALLQNLPEDSAFCRLINIRTCPIPKPNKHNGEQIKALMKAKAKYRLRLSEEEERQQYQKSLQKIAACLMGGEQNG